jgi:anti-sigma factor RsiW
MQKHSDEALVAYLDGELDPAERRHVEAWLEADPAVRQRLDALAGTSELVRSAYADIVNEPVPERLLAAALGETAGTAEPGQEAEILVLRPRRARGPLPGRRWHVGMAAAAGLFGVIFGGAGTYVGLGVLNRTNPGDEQRIAAAAVNKMWLDNAAAAYRIAANAGDTVPVDVPASNDPRERFQQISLPKVRLPDLKPWGLELRGTRLVAFDGRPAAQLVYVTDNKAIGPLSLVIGTTKQPDTPRTIEQRQDVNLLYWRHQGRAYALAGRADVGYLWGISADVSWQLERNLE